MKKTQNISCQPNILEIDSKTIHEELVTALGPSAPSYTTVTGWAKHFREGREDVNDHPRSANLVSQFTDEHIQLVRQVISNDPHSTYDEIMPETSLSLSLSLSLSVPLSWYNRANYP